jgi:hypothetical protein
MSRAKYVLNTQTTARTRLAAKTTHQDLSLQGMEEVQINL